MRFSASRVAEDDVPSDKSRCFIKCFITGFYVFQKLAVFVHDEESPSTKLTH